MKKILFAAAMIVAMSFASCDSKTTSDAVADSTSVDTTVVDSAAVDSVSADSVCNL